MIGYEKKMFGTFGEQILSSIEKKALLSYLNPKLGETVLDLGTGSGRIAEEVVKTGAIVYGIDKDIKVIFQAKRKKIDRKKYELLRVDASRPLPFKKNVFDSAYCIRVLKYITNYADVIIEVQRVLKLNGIFVLEISNVFSWEILLRFSDLFRIKKPYRYKLFRKSEVLKILRENNFEIRESQPLHKLPNIVWRCFGRAAYFIDIIFKRILPEELLSRGIILKCKLKKNKIGEAPRARLKQGLRELEEKKLA